MQKQVTTARLGALAFAIVNLTFFAGAALVPSQPPASAALPASTAIPISFVKSIDAKKARVGDTVTARTMQVIMLPSGGSIAKGTVVTGHVVAVQPFHFDTTPYVHQAPSLLSIHFDQVQAGGSAIPVNLSVRAIANVLDSREAAYPHSHGDPDDFGMMDLIGGTSFSPLEKIIQSSNGDAIGYNRKDGVFARLTASASASKTPAGCEATNTEQSVAIFSPDACGLYGFAGDYLSANGQDGSGTFTLAVRGRSEKLYAGTTALLQMNQAN